MDKALTSAMHFDTLTDLMGSINAQKPEVSSQITRAVQESFEKNNNDITASRTTRRAKVAEILNAEFGKELYAEYIRLSGKAWTPEPREKKGAAPVAAIDIP